MRICFVHRRNAQKVRLLALIVAVLKDAINTIQIPETKIANLSTVLHYGRGSQKLGQVFNENASNAGVGNNCLNTGIE